MPKGTDLSVYSQEQLDAIAYELNIRPCKRFDFKCPIEVMTEVVAKRLFQSSNRVALSFCIRPLMCASTRIGI